MRIASLGVLLFLVVSGAPAFAGEPTSDRIGASFVERFARLDRNRWSISNGWSNGPHQNCTFSPNNVRLVDTGIELMLSDDKGRDRPFSCAEVQSSELYGYGTYEVRMRSAVAPGLVTAFFTYTGPGQKPGRPHDEVDFEFLGKNPKSVQLNFFASGKGEHGHDVDLAFDASATVNDYAFEWLPDVMRWYVNGSLVHQIERAGMEHYPTNPGKIIISIWNGTGENMKNWLAEFKYPGKPLIAAYEYISFTQAGAPCQFPKSIVCKKAASSSSGDPASLHR